MGHSHHALPVDLNDAVSNADSTTLSSAPTQQATNDSILHTEAQLLAHVGPADDGRGDRWAVDNTQRHG